MFSKLRHPVRAIREPFGTAGLILACVALIAALTGGAYAASGGLTAKQKKEVKKIAKKFAGKPGAPGPTGPAGSAGSKGDTGAKGDSGASGTSATAVSFTGEQHGCASGGIEVKSAGAPTFVCNGETGFTEKLPPGKTETGAWAFGTTGGVQPQYVPISFNIPLEQAPTIHVIKKNGLEKAFNSDIGGYEEIEQPNCPGGVTEPTAEPGNLCLYTEAESEINVGNHPFLSKSYTTGAVLTVIVEGGSSESGFGTWAVTAPN
jgi:hypothetical protein